MNYIEKCIPEHDFLASKGNCSNPKYITKTFPFSFKCSEKFPYKMINQKRCVQYCNNELLKSGNCVLKSNETLQEKLLILNENNNQIF